MKKEQVTIQSIQNLEKGILCAILMDEKILEYVLENIRNNEFTFLFHQIAFAAMHEIHKSGYEVHLDDLVRVLLRMDSSLNEDMVIDIFTFPPSNNYVKDVETMINNAMSRYELKSQCRLDMLTQVIINDTHQDWAVNYVENTFYGVVSVNIGDIPIEYKLDMRDTVESIDINSLTDHYMLASETQSDKISRLCFIK